MHCALESVQEPEVQLVVVARRPVVATEANTRNVEWRRGLVKSPGSFLFSCSEPALNLCVTFPGSLL